MGTGVTLSGARDVSDIPGKCIWEQLSHLGPSEGWRHRPRKIVGGKDASARSSRLQIRQRGQLSSVLLSESLADLVGRIAFGLQFGLLRPQLCDRLLKLRNDRDEIGRSEPAVFRRDVGGMRSATFDLLDVLSACLVTGTLLMKELASVWVAQDGPRGNPLA